MDPFSIAVGTLALVQLCIKSSALLRDAIQSINSTNQEVRNILAELGSLIEILQSLERNATADKDAFTSLDFVLKQCTRACDNLHEALSKALGDSNQSKGIKVWIRLKRQENDIEGFKKLIDSYKATLTIAVADANL
jgi:ABC-type transporter Mla subunit MlaD